MADKSENFIYVCASCAKKHGFLEEEEDGETLSSTEEMSSDSDVEMTDSFIVDDADSGISDSDDSYELSDDDSSSS